MKDYFFHNIVHSDDDEFHDMLQLSKFRTLKLFLKM